MKLMEELDAINKEMLNEGVLDMLRNTKDWAKRMVNKVQNAWNKFVNFVYEKIILRLKYIPEEQYARAASALSSSVLPG